MSNENKYAIEQIDRAMEGNGNKYFLKLIIKGAKYNTEQISISEDQARAIKEILRK